MSGLIGAINTALTGLEAFEEGISTVSENLSNQSTPGYSAESVNFGTAQDIPGGPGSGVQNPHISRAANGFASSMLNSATSANSASGTLSTALTNISNALQNNGNVHTALNQFYEDVSTLAASPSHQAAQQTVLSDAQNIASTFQSAAASLTAVQSGANTALGQNVTAANNLLGQLAKINQALSSTPNDPSLLDQQQAALTSLSALMPVNVLPQENGQVLVYNGGSVLVGQDGAHTLNLTPGNGATPPSITAGTSNVPLSLGSADGSIGANIAAYNAGGAALQSLGALAATVASNVNDVQAQGLTPNGTEGGPIFSVPAPSVAAAAGKTGSAALSAQITNVAQLPANGGPFTLSYSTSGGWTAVNQATGSSTPVTTGNNGASPALTTLAFAGMTVTVNSGTAANGDSYVVNPAPGGASGLAVTATQPDDIAAADPFAATPGTLQSSGTITDGNAGTTTIGTDTVISAAAAAATSGAAMVPASFWNTHTFGATSMQLVYNSSSPPTGYTLETTDTPPVPIATGTLSGSNNSGTVLIAYPAGSAAAGQVWSLPISGKPAAGDTITLTPGGSSSGSNATRLAAQWTAAGTTSGGSLQQSTIGLSTSLGASAQAAQQLSTGTSSQLASATTNLQNISGVSSDQQAVVLVNYQQAYQAAAQVISTAHTMFESLLQSV
jgi:flagellar hook-associated protein 1 FlgK